MRCPPLICFQTGASLQQKADGWKEKVNETRGSRPRTPTHLDQEAQVPTCYMDQSIILIQYDDPIILYQYSKHQTACRETVLAWDALPVSVYSLSGMIYGKLHSPHCALYFIPMVYQYITLLYFSKKHSLVFNLLYHLHWKDFTGHSWISDAI